MKLVHNQNQFCKLGFPNGLQAIVLPIYEVIPLLSLANLQLPKSSSCIHRLAQEQTLPLPSFTMSKSAPSNEIGRRQNLSNRVNVHRFDDFGEFQSNLSKRNQLGKFDKFCHFHYCVHFWKQKLTWWVKHKKKKKERKKEKKR